MRLSAAADRPPSWPDFPLTACSSSSPKRTRMCSSRSRPSSVASPTEPEADAAIQAVGGQRQLAEPELADAARLVQCPTRAWSGRPRTSFSSCCADSAVVARNLVSSSLTWYLRGQRPPHRAGGTCATASRAFAGVSPSASRTEAAIISMARAVGVADHIGHARVHERKGMLAVTRAGEDLEVRELLARQHGGTGRGVDVVDRQHQDLRALGNPQRAADPAWRRPRNRPCCRSAVRNPRASGCCRAQ